MSDTFKAEWETKTKIAMGERVGAIEAYLFLQRTACVHLEERELIAYAEAYPVICPEDEEFNKFLTEKVIPVLTTVGRGKWYRDTITDLALALSKTKKGREKEDAGGLLEDDEAPEA